MRVSMSCSLLVWSKGHRCKWMILFLFIFLGLQKKMFAADRPSFPLKTKGRWIVDQLDQRVKLKAVNWYGAHLAEEVPGGLDQRSIRQIIGLIKQWGFNTVRLPFSNQMIHRQEAVPIEKIAANPELYGKNPIEILEEVINILAEEKIMVVLNNHTTSSEWCCGFDHNGLWFTKAGGYPQTYEQWEADWLEMHDRFASNEWVIAADLRNEVRTGRIDGTVIPMIPGWGQGGASDWYEASRRTAQKLLERGQSWLYIVEGINWEGLIPALGSGSRPHLRPMAELPLQLTSSRKIVYGVHTYAYTGPEHTGDNRTSPGRLRYQDYSREELFRLYDQEFGFMLDQNQFFVAPVWVSEFGVDRGSLTHQVQNQSVGPKGIPFLGNHQTSSSSQAFQDGAEKQWFASLVDYLVARDIDFAYWPLNPDSYGLVTSDWSRILNDDWRFPHLKKLVESGFVGTIDVATSWSLLDLNRGDFRGDVDPSRGETSIDWLPGASKAVCRDFERVIGLSTNLRALCIGDLGESPLKNQVHGKTPWQYNRQEAVVVAVDESYGHGHSQGDWANGLTKYECPYGSMVTGLTKHWWGLSGIRCQKPLNLNPQSCQTLWFKDRDQRLESFGGDFAIKSFKGQCQENDYIAGVAHRDGKPGAILCCNFGLN